MRLALLLLAPIAATSWAAVDQGADHGGDIGRRGHAVLGCLHGLIFGALLAGAVAAVLGRDTRRWANTGALIGALFGGILAY